MTGADAKVFAAYPFGAPHQCVRLPAEAAGPVEAALLYAEHWLEADEARIIVRDCETGEEFCFHVDLRAGEIEPCA